VASARSSGLLPKAWGSAHQPTLSRWSLTLSTMLGRFEFSKLRARNLLIWWERKTQENSSWYLGIAPGTIPLQDLFRWVTSPKQKQNNGDQDHSIFGRWNASWSLNSCEIGIVMKGKVPNAYVFVSHTFPRIWSDRVTVWASSTVNPYTSPVRESGLCQTWRTIRGCELPGNGIRHGGDWSFSGFAAFKPTRESVVLHAQAD